MPMIFRGHLTTELAGLPPKDISKNTTGFVGKDVSAIICNSQA